jgi:hypothetical protein
VRRLLAALKLTLVHRSGPIHTRLASKHDQPGNTDKSRYDPSAEDRYRLKRLILLALPKGKLELLLSP